jgi:molecular chaperone GrpE
MSMSKQEPGYTVVDRRFSSTEVAAEETPAERKLSFVSELEERLRAMDEELIAVRARHARMVREFEDARARTLRDVGQEIERGKEAILADLVEVADNLDRAIDAAKQKPELNALLRGVEMARDQFLSKLKNYGVLRVDPQGAPFDPSRHEAVSTVPSQSPEQVGTVAGVIRALYLIGDKTLRAAMVAVHG